MIDRVLMQTGLIILGLGSFVAGLMYVFLGENGWRSRVRALGFGLAAIFLFAVAHALAGCSPPTGVSSIGRPIIDGFEGAEFVDYDCERGREYGSLRVWKHGAVSLVTVVEGASCGPILGFPPRERELGPFVSIARAFNGVAPGVPFPGDTLRGVVYPSVEIDTFTVTAGGFLLACNDSLGADVLVGHAWVRWPGAAACGRESLATHLTMVRVRP